MKYRDPHKTPKMVIFTDTDADGVTSAAQLYRYYSKTGFRPKKRKRHKTYDCETIYTTNRGLKASLSQIDPDIEIDKLYITDLRIEEDAKIQSTLEEILEKNCKITIISDKKMPLYVRLIEDDRFEYQSANFKENIGKSTSQIVYKYLEKKNRGPLDNAYDSLANMGARADGIIGGREEFQEHFRHAIELDYAIRVEKISDEKDYNFFNKILHELADHGQIEDRVLQEKIERKSAEFEKLVNKARDVILKEENILFKDNTYLVSKIDSNPDYSKYPFGMACSNIRHESNRNVVLIQPLPNNKNDLIILIGNNNNGSGNDNEDSGNSTHNITTLRNDLKKYFITGGGHAGIRCKGYYTFDRKHVDEVTRAVEAFCSAAT